MSRKKLIQRLEASLRSGKKCAQSLYKRGKYEEAEEIWQMLLLMYIDLFGITHPKTLETVWEICRMLNNLGYTDRIQNLKRIILSRASFLTQVESLRMAGIINSLEMMNWGNNDLLKRSEAA